MGHFMSLLCSNTEACGTMLPSTLNNPNDKLKVLTLDREGDIRGEGLAEHDVVGLTSVNSIIVLGLSQKHVSILALSS